jgi:two-component system, OmpR family, KDP operon response regulator KdpE
VPVMKHELVPPGGKMALCLTNLFQPPLDLASSFSRSHWAYLERPVAGDTNRLVRELGPDLVILCCDSRRQEDLVLLRELARIHAGELIAYSRTLSSETDIALLDCGADATLHFDDPEALVQTTVKAAMRRVEARVDSWLSSHEQTELTFGDIQIDPVRFEVRVAGERVHFPASEYRIMAILAASAGRVLSPREIMEAATGSPYSELEARDSVKVYIGRMRNRLTELGIPRTAIRNVRGFGYVLEPRDCATDFSRLLRA